jgi:hypothetical protein
MGSTGYLAQDSHQLINKFDFYSGSQITVWFGNIMIDDIVSIQWVRSQNKMPIYGYASQYWDAVAKGTIMINGTFMINFRQQGYMQAIMDTIKTLYNNLQPTDAEAKIQFSKSTWPAMQQMISNSLSNGTFGPATMQEIQDLGNNPNFFELAKQYENVVWGKYTNQNPAVDATPPDIKQTTDIPDGFNIQISYGDPTSAQSNTMLGQLHSTTKSLVGVHLTGESQLIMVGGRPVQEQYSFIARSSDENLGRAS